MERVALAPGLEISRILTGLWQIADLERDGESLDPKATAEQMRPYVDAGLTTFDMADHYGSAEIIAGAYARLPGAHGVELLTKWVPKPGASTREEVRRAVQRSLDRLGVERLDLLQFHAWSYADPGWLDCLYHLQELKAEGLIAHLGVTNFDTAHLRILVQSGIEVVSNQICYSLLDQRAAGAMAELCQEHGIGLLAFGTVGGGFLTETWLGRPEPGPGELATWSQMKYKRFIDVAGGWEPFQALLRALRTVADRHDVSMANVACRFILDRPAVAGIIVGARLGRSEHVGDNVRLLDLHIDEESQALLRDALTGLDPVPGDCGDEYRKPPFLTAAGDLSDHFDDFPAPYEVRDEGDGRQRCLSGTVWEDLAGFSRAVRIGDRILVSGTTATHGHRNVGGDDPAAQAHFCIDKLEGAIQSLGGRLEDVVRTRVYLQREQDWEAVSRAHGERFGHVRPANTLIRAGLIGEGYLVEMEAEAVVGPR